jgi:hypothetical protein
VQLAPRVPPLRPFPVRQPVVRVGSSSTAYEGDVLYCRYRTEMGRLIRDFIIYGISEARVSVPEFSWLKD